MSAIKSAIKCIEDHKLESHFKIDNLKKRLKELDKVKSKKIYASSFTSSKPLNKRPRSERSGSRLPKSVRLALASHQKNHHAPPSASRISAPYSYVTPTVDESSPTVTVYGGQSPVRYGLQYAYPSNVAASLAPTYQ